jgi:hypothetical protein
MDLCSQRVRKSIEYFEELTYRNAMGLCPQQVCESIKYFEELTYRHATVCVLSEYVNPWYISRN